MLPLKQIICADKWQIGKIAVQYERILHIHCVVKIFGGKNNGI